MSVKRAFLFFIVVAIIGVSMFVLLSRNKPTPAELLKAEQEVYSVVLQDMRTAYSIEINKFQVVEFTSSIDLTGNIPADYNKDFPKDLLTLKKATWKDYLEKNELSYPIKNYLPFTVDVTLVTTPGGLVNSGTSSKEFYWWVSLSRIGFDSSLTQALVLVGDCRGESCYDNTAMSMYSQGYLYFLEKENGKWILKDYPRVWISEMPAP